MSNENAKIDDNRKKSLLAVTDDASAEIRRLLVDPTTGRLKVSAVLSASAGVNSLAKDGESGAQGDVTLSEGVNISLTQAGTDIEIATTGNINFSLTDNGNSGLADTIDWSVSNKQKSTLTDNCEFTFSDPGNACAVQLILIQDVTGSRTVTWPAEVKWPDGTAPTLSTGANSVDIISFLFDGTNYYGVASLNFS